MIDETPDMAAPVRATLPPEEPCDRCGKLVRPWSLELDSKGLSACPDCRAADKKQRMLVIVGSVVGIILAVAAVGFGMYRHNSGPTASMNELRQAMVEKNLAKAGRYADLAAMKATFDPWREEKDEEAFLASTIAEEGLKRIQVTKVRGRTAEAEGQVVATSPKGGRLGFTVHYLVTKTGGSGPTLWRVTKVTNAEALMVGVTEYAKQLRPTPVLAP